jgi:uncharacterized protein YerC
MTDPAKIDAVRSYLQNTFPEHDISDKSRSASAHDFHISRVGVSYKVTVKSTFLDDHTPAEIEALLHRWRLERELRKSERAGVIVGNGGLSHAWPDVPRP